MEAALEAGRLFLIEGMEDCAGWDILGCLGHSVKILYIGFCTKK